MQNTFKEIMLELNTPGNVIPAKWNANFQIGHIYASEREGQAGIYYRCRIISKIPYRDHDEDSFRYDVSYAFHILCLATYNVY